MFNCYTVIFLALKPETPFHFLNSAITNFFQGVFTVTNRNITAHLADAENFGSLNTYHDDHMMTKNCSRYHASVSCYNVKFTIHSLKASKCFPFYTKVCILQINQQASAVRVRRSSLPPLSIPPCHQGRRRKDKQGKLNER